MDVDKAIQFLLDALARLEANAGRHDEEMAEIRSGVSALTGLTSRLAETMNGLALAQQMVAGAQSDINQQLAAAQARTEEALEHFAAETQRSLAELAQAQSRTDARILTLIDRIRPGPSHGAGVAMSVA